MFSAPGLRHQQRPLNPVGWRLPIRALCLVSFGSSWEVFNEAAFPQKGSAPIAFSPNTRADHWFSAGAGAAPWLIQCPTNSCWAKRFWGKRENNNSLEPFPPSVRAKFISQEISFAFKKNDINLCNRRKLVSLFGKVLLSFMLATSLAQKSETNWENESQKVWDLQNRNCYNTYTGIEGTFQIFKWFHPTTFGSKW